MSDHVVLDKFIYFSENCMTDSCCLLFQRNMHAVAVLKMLLTTECAGVLTSVCKILARWILLDVFFSVIFLLVSKEFYHVCCCHEVLLAVLPFQTIKLCYLAWWILHGPISCSYGYLDFSLKCELFSLKLNELDFRPVAIVLWTWY